MREKVEGLSKSLKLLVKTSFIVLIGVIISKLLGYTYRIIIARYYGPEVYGLFVLALMVSGWFTAISALGLSDGLLRFVALYRGKNENEKVRYLLSLSINILLITSILSGFLLFALSDYISITFFHSLELIIYLRIFSIAVPITIMGSVFISVIKSHEEIAWVSFLYNVAQNIVKVFTLWMLIVIGFNSGAVALSYVIGLGSIFIGSYIVCRYKLPHVFGKTKLPHDERILLRREILNYSIPMLFFAIVSTMFYWIDSFSLGYYKGVIEVGLYNSAVPIAVILGIVPELFMQLFFPLITREYAKSKIGLIEQLSKQVAKWILLVNLPIFAIMIVFPGALIRIFFGTEYLLAENALRILSISALFSSIFIVSNQLISMIGKSKLILINITIASLINLLLNAILVPMENIGFIDNANGLSGAAIATLISVLIFNMLFMIQSYKYLKIIPVRRKMINLFVIAALSTGMLAYLRTIWGSNDLMTLAILLATFLFVYVALVLLTGALDENDRKIMQTIWDKALFWRKANSKE